MKNEALAALIFLFVIFFVYIGFMVWMVTYVGGDKSRQIMDGQCSQMHFFLATHSFKPNDEIITQKVYDEECKGR